jgi:hypothetical protein
VVDHVWSACGRIPVGLGNDVMRRRISDAFGRDGGKDSLSAGVVPKKERAC